MILASLLLSLTLICGAAVQNAQQKAADPKRTDDFTYVIKGCNGMVAVFKDGSEQPEEILDCPLDSLPQEEISRLQNGITVMDEGELQKLIEAYD